MAKVPTSQKIIAGLVSLNFVAFGVFLTTQTPVDIVGPTTSATAINTHPKVMGIVIILFGLFLMWIFSTTPRSVLEESNVQANNPQHLSPTEIFQQTFYSRYLREICLAFALVSWAAFGYLYIQNRYVNQPVTHSGLTTSEIKLISLSLILSMFAVFLLLLRSKKS